MVSLAMVLSRIKQLEKEYPDLVGVNSAYYRVRVFQLFPGHYTLLRDLLNDLATTDQGRQSVIICNILYRSSGKLLIEGRGLSSKQKKLVTQASNDSLSICSDCGDSGKPVELIRGFFKVLCPHHAIDVEYKAVILQLPRDLHTEISRVAQTLGDTPSDLMLDAIHEYLDRKTAIRSIDNGTFIFWGEN